MVITKEDLEISKKSLTFKKGLKYGLLSTFAACSISPLVFKNYTDLNTKSLLLWSGFVAGILGGIPIDWSKEEKLLKTFKAVEDAALKEQIKGDILVCDLEIQALNHKKVVDLAEKLPFNIQPKFAKEWGVKNELTENWIKDEPTPPPPGIELADEHRWILNVLKEPFKVLTGEQGSGKSTFERLLIDLLRQEGHHIFIINPETIRSGASDVTVLHKIELINEFFEQFPKLIERRQQEARLKNIDEDDYLEYLESQVGVKGRVAIFLMEANTYEAHGVDSELWATFLKQMSTNIRKWGFTAVLTAHSANQTSISSKLKGFSALLDSAVHIECLATTNSKGEKVGSGKACLKRGKSDSGEVVFTPYYKPKSKDY